MQVSRFTIIRFFNGPRQQLRTDTLFPLVGHDRNPDELYFIRYKPQIHVTDNFHPVGSNQKITGALQEIMSQRLCRPWIRKAIFFNSFNSRQIIGDRDTNIYFIFRRFSHSTSASLLRKY